MTWRAWCESLERVLALTIVLVVGALLAGVRL